MAKTFNGKLDDRNKRFTFFVPRDKAWQTLQRMLPSVHKKLFMPDFSYHAEMILERHLVIADKAYTMSEMMAKGENDSFVTMTAYRGEVKIKIREEEKSKYNYLSFMPNNVTKIHSLRFTKINNVNINCSV